MAEWWFIIVVVVVVAAAIAYFMRARGQGGGTTGAPVDAERNYGDEREANRVGGLSDEDREWEAASLERNRQAQERGKTPPADGGDAPR